MGYKGEYRIGIYVREWSLITGKGGGGGYVKFHPYRKGRWRGRTSFSHAEGGGGDAKFWVVLTREENISPHHPLANKKMIFPSL